MIRSARSSSWPGLAGLLALASGWPLPVSEQVTLLGTLGTVLPAPWYVANRPPLRRKGLRLAVLCGLAALAGNAFGGDGLGFWQLLGDLNGAVVAGGICFAMVFAHGYLTVPDLPRSHLARINQFVGTALALRLLLSAGVLWAGWPGISPAGEGLDAFGELDLGVRFVAGLLLPLIFALMVRSSLRWGNTQSATGILYAATILVWIGEAVALQLGSQWRIPL
ncbi:MAG: hypothetical protein ACE5H3_01045 [Planctomycetota bacterium]